MATALLLGLPSVAAAHEDEFEHGWTSAEKREGVDRVLTLETIHQLAAIGAGLNSLARRDPDTCRWMNQIAGPETLARQVQAFDTNPIVRRVIEAARMTVRSYLLTIHAVSATAIAVHAAENHIEVAVAASATNVAFYRAHRSEIETLLDLPDPC